MIEVRPLRAEDKNFVLSTWLRGLYHGNEFFGLIPQDTYYKAYHAVVEHILNDPRTHVRIACLSDDPDVILGYAVLSEDLQAVHWVFVKSAFRENGIAKLLVPPLVTTATHLTKVGTSILKKKKLIFNPFL